VTTHHAQFGSVNYIVQVTYIDLPFNPASHHFYIVQNKLSETKPWDKASTIPCTNYMCLYNYGNSSCTGHCVLKVKELPAVILELSREVASNSLTD